MPRLIPSVRRLLCATACALLAPMAAHATLMTMQPASAADIGLVNTGFEANWSGVGSVGTDGYVTFVYSPTGTAMGWTFGAGTGASGTYSLLTASEGSRFAFLQNGTDLLSQTFTLADSQQLTLNFDLALRGGYSTGQVVRVSVDGHDLGDFAALQTTWTQESLSLGILAAGDHTLGFRGVNPGNAVDTTAFIDSVSLTGTAATLTGGAVPEPQSLALALTALAGVAALRRRKA
jgi:methionine-rich copper-binding protein CopC